MKTRFLICSIVVLSLSMFIASAALAECRPGKIEVTIVTPAGKVIVICVPEAAVDHIGGPGDVVIPAICPGFSQEEVEAVLNDYPNIVCERIDGYTLLTGDPCTYIECYDDTCEDICFGALEGPEDMGVFGPCCFEGIGQAMDNNICFNCVTDYWSDEISEEEADVCAAILNTFVP